MAILNQKAVINVVPGVAAQTVVHLSQGNVGDTVELSVYADSEPFNTSPLVASVQGVRKDGTGFGPIACVTGGNLVRFTVASAMTALEGPVLAEVTFSNGSATVGTANFAMLIEQGTFPNGPTYDTDISVYQQILAYVQSYPAMDQSRINTAVAAEAAERRAADNTLQAAIEAEATARNTADQELQQNIEAEAQERRNADTALSGAISAEAAERDSADQNLQTQINELVAPTGEAPSAAEVENARVGADGVTYSSLGDAIRTQITNTEELITFRGRDALTQGFDLDDTANTMPAGYYLKDDGVTVTGGVNASRARVIYFRGTGGAGKTQLWHDTYTNMLYYRAKNLSATSWSDWAPTVSDSADIELTNDIAVPDGTGTWASGVSNVGRSLSCICRYGVKGGKRAIVTWHPTSRNSSNALSDLLYIMQYDANGALLRATAATATDTTMTAVLKLESGTEALAFNIYNSAGAVLPTNGKINLLVEGCGNIREEKNPAFASNQTGNDWYRFGYKVEDKKGSGDTYTQVNTTGVIMFPPNYDRNGKKTPVIIMVHGSEAYRSIYANPIEIAAYEPYYEFLRDCGFALIDCYPWTTLYDSRAQYTEEGSTIRTHNPWVIPTSCKAYEKLLRLVLKGFNFDPDNVFIMCKSLGGQMASWLSTALNIRAAGFLAPALALNFGYTNRIYRELIAEDMGLVGVVNSSLGWSTASACMEDFYTNYLTWNADKRNAFYNGNQQAIMGWSSEFKYTAGGTVAEKFDYNARKASYEATGYAKISYPPTKIWFADDDENISAPMCHTYATQLRNGGQVGIARVMPNGTGGHHSVDTDPNAPKVASVVTPLGYTHTNIPVAYYELFEFFYKNIVH